MRGDSGSDIDTTNLTKISDESSGPRSIIVVGDGVVAATTAGFLEQAGLDPVLATSTANELSTTVRLLWEPALTFLERIGLRRPIEQFGIQIDGLHCLTGQNRWNTADGVTTPLVAIESDRLRSLIRRQLRNRLTETDQVVTALEPTGSGVRATFEETPTELCDVAITTTRSCLPDHQRVLTAQTVDTWEFSYSDAEIDQHILTEAWSQQRAAFSVPVPHARSIRLVSVAETPSNATLATDILAERFGHLIPGTPFDDLEHTDLYYQRVPCAVPRRLTSDGIALVGSDTRCSIPSDCMSSTLGIEDAWVIADALAYGPSDLELALTSYARRRRQRVSDITCSTAGQHDTTHGPVEQTPVLRRLYCKRRLALGDTVDHSFWRLPECVPTDL